MRNGAVSRAVAKFSQCHCCGQNVMSAEYSSCCERTAVRNIHRNGAAITNAITTSANQSSTLRVVRRRLVEEDRRVPASTGAPVPLTSTVSLAGASRESASVITTSGDLAGDERQDHQDHQQHHRLCRGQAHPELLERRLVDLVGDHRGGVRRSAGGEDVDQVEGLERSEERRVGKEG